MENLNVLRAAEAAKYLGIGKSTFWAWTKANKIPKADIHLGVRITLWRRETLDKFLSSAEAEKQG
jgi:excisionase family DNA binding protein